MHSPTRGESPPLSAGCTAVTLGLLFLVLPGTAAGGEPLGAIVVLAPRVGSAPAAVASELAVVARDLRAGLLERLTRLPGVELVMPGLDAAHRAGAPLPRWRPDPVPGAAARLASAITAYEELRLGDAIGTLLALRADLEPYWEALPDAELYPRVLLWLAVAELADDRPAAAETFGSYAALRPDVKLSIEEHPPPVLAAYDRARKAAAGKAALSVRSDPAGAELQLDGIVRGRTPVTLTGLPAGVHTVRISAPGRLPYVARVELGRGGAADVSVPLLEDGAAVLLARIDAAVGTASWEEVGALASALAGSLGVKRVLIPVVQPWRDGWLVSALCAPSGPAGAPPGATLAVATVDRALREMPGALAMIMVAVEGASRPGGAGVTARSPGGSAPPAPVVGAGRPLLSLAGDGGSPAGGTYTATGALGPGTAGSSSASRAGRPLVARWWFWTAATVVAVAVAGGIWLAVAIRPGVGVTATFPEEP